MIKLKPCPFCGSEAELVDYGLNGNFKVVQCSVCGARTRMFDTDIKRGENAVEAWNKRTIPKTTRILADVLDGTPLLFPCSKLFEPGGWCKEHCKTQEPDAECWLRYVEVLANEQQAEGD